MEIYLEILLTGLNFQSLDSFEVLAVVRQKDGK